MGFRRSIRAASGAWLALVIPLAVPGSARAACSWVDSVTAWDGSLAWSFAHQASWSDTPRVFESKTRDEMSSTFELEAVAPGYAQGEMEGTMKESDRLDVSGVGAPAYTSYQASGPIDAHAPPPPQVSLFLDSFACTYTFLYGPQLGANGTQTVHSGSGTTTVPTIVDPGSLGIPPRIPIPSQPQPLTFSGQVDSYGDLLPLPPIAEPYYSVPGSAQDSAEALGDPQLAKASVQWSFQPKSLQQPRNDACAGASLLDGVVQDVTFATASPADPTPSCGSGDRSVWFLVHAGGGGLASVYTLGTDYGTIVSIWPMAEPCDALHTQLACGAGSASWTAEEGETYRVEIARVSGSGGSLVATAYVPEPEAAIARAVAFALIGWMHMRRRAQRSRRVPRRFA